MPLYDADNRLTADLCAVRLKDRANASVAQYALTNLRAECPDDRKVFVDGHPLAWAAEHRNLWSWDGYGLNVRAVDSDSKLRDSEATHMRARIQLPKRVFHAVPSLAHGQPAPDAEARIQSGLDTAPVRACDRLAERDFHRFNPAVAAVPVEHIVPPWTNGGAPSRDIARSDEFLAGLGYRFDGKVWRRAT